MARRRLIPARGGSFFSTPCGRLAPGSWRSRTALGAHRPLLGPYDSRTTLAPCRPRPTLDPSRSRSTLCLNQSPSTLDPHRPHAALDLNQSRPTVDPHRPHAALDPSRSAPTVDPSRSRSTLGLNQSPSTLDPHRPHAALDLNRPRPTLGLNQSPSTLDPNRSRPAPACRPSPPALRRRVPAPRAGRHAVRGERDRGLVEGPLHHAVVGARGEGHDERVGHAVAAQRRLGVQGRFDAVAVPMPQCRRAPPFLGAGEGEPGRPGSPLAEEQIRRGAPYDLRSPVAQQSSSALAPPCDHAVQAEGDRRDIG
ncbi:hypothetical protein OG806_05480 [Streptomyces sp. NBC_00882]|uniref:hypothetical protein n=1 Tax=Streptomyces TaxID=1883 RepID=UPI0038697A42|nr:hypothetical protein OG806_05480 [Streptomyces sp. NBC_00882]WSZ64297.1 hypothetical protein OH824_05055 [Streptomyces canus]